MRETEHHPSSDDARLLMGTAAPTNGEGALGSDPFAEFDDFDPFLEGLAAPKATPLRRRKRAPVPMLDEVELPEAGDSRREPWWHSALRRRHGHYRHHAA